MPRADSTNDGCQILTNIQYHSPGQRVDEIHTMTATRMRSVALSPGVPDYLTGGVRRVGGGKYRIRPP